MFRFAISNAFRRKGIALFAILGTALGIALMTVLISISDGMDDMMNEMMTDLSGGIAVHPADAPLGYMTGGGTPFPISYAEGIEGIDHVEEVIPLVVTFVPKEAANFGDPLGVTMRGVELERSAEPDSPINSSNIIEGRTITQGENEIILGYLVAAFGRAEGGEYAEVGGQFTVTTIWGDPITLTVVGIFETESNVHDMYIYTDIDTARVLTGLDSDEINFIQVEVDNTENVETVAATIEAMFDDPPVRTTIATELLEDINEAMSVFSNFLWIVSLVAAIAGGVSIFIVMLISVIERTKEFGILKASGWSNGNIISSVVVQSIAIGLLGAAIGLAIGYGAGKGIDAYLTMDIATITWRLIVIIAAFGIIVGVVGGLYPALRAARVSPIESLRAL